MANRYTRMFTDCPYYGPDGDHYYADENTGEYRAFCSCGHPDPFAPGEDDGVLVPVLSADVNPPF